MKQPQQSTLPHETIQQLLLLNTTKTTKQKINLSDRFIPHHISTHTSIHKQITIDQSQNKQNTLSNYQHIIQQHILNRNNTEKNQPITIFRNHNLLQFSHNQTHKINQKSHLSGMELRDQLQSFKSPKRNIKNISVKVLQAPALIDDFYLNLIDWSPFNSIAVSLATSTYLWNTQTSQSTKLCDFGVHNFPTSVSFSPKHPILAIGTHSGIVNLWDIQKKCRIRSMGGQTKRVGSISWGNNLLSTGSRDTSILQRDIRCYQPYISKLQSHSQQICGLKWSHDSQQLCSGGNDNRLIIWSPHSDKPQTVYNDHTAAVKAIAWSPHQHGILASGGGTADRTIKFRNTLTGQTTKQWDTGSQVCNLAFSRSLNEIVSTHGFQKNQVAIWDCQNNKRIAQLTGHKFRVVFLAMSPDGSTIVTGSGDETIRFWQIFPPSHRIPSQCTLENTSNSLR